VTTKIKPYTGITALAAAAAVLSVPEHFAGWLALLLVVPIGYWMCRCYLGLIKDEHQNMEDMANLHLRTIEALALAIETKDSTMQGHLRRVEVWTVEIGKELGLSEPELKALRAAALLHDIGTLAVPELISSKPGQLSPMEFEKVKIHCVVGAEILERVEFPYPVAPIVRFHHEKWDGTGYPAGLSGDEIPIGSRILAAVDCLDAMSSERPYRKAMPLSQAVAHVKSEAGKSFDPRVVDALARSYDKLERIMQAEQIGRSAPVDFLSSIHSARLEAQTLFDLMHDLGASLSLDETLSMLAVGLKRICPYDCIAVYIRRGGKLIPEFVSGENFEIFSSREIPMGEGLSGLVAQNGEPVLNGDPLLEAAYLSNTENFSTLRSALSAPLEGVDGTVGVLTLYSANQGAFTRDHLRLLLALTRKVALSIENALRYQEAETCAATDRLTGLPNARSLFLHLDGEIARCKREDKLITVLVCNLDGPLKDNKVLQAVAQGLRENCREYDYVARMSGDEFVVVLPGCPAEATQTKVRLLCEIVAQAGELSMSVGKAVFPADGLDAEQLLAEAHQRMCESRGEHTRLCGAARF
jgi:diguanylate cyclase (GGDEF)-like protein/putative nucleotidyltransferase with HDIG domain